MAVAALALLFLLATLAWRAWFGVVHLRIVDPAGRGIAGATVIVGVWVPFRNPFEESIVKHGYHADDDGRVTFSAPPPWQRWHVEAIASGYVPNGMTGRSEDELVLRPLPSAAERKSLAYGEGSVGYTEEGVPYGFHFSSGSVTSDLAVADLVPEKVPGERGNCMRPSSGAGLLGLVVDGSVEEKYSFHQQDECPLVGYDTKAAIRGGAEPAMYFFRTGDGRFGMLKTRFFSHGPRGQTSSTNFDWVLQTEPSSRRLGCPHVFPLESFEGIVAVGEVEWE